LKSKVTVQPLIEPVTLAEVKASLRITNTAEDTLLTQFITDARVFVERITGRKLINQEITTYYNGFDPRPETDDTWRPGYRMAPITNTYGDLSLTLEFAPVGSITSIAAVDIDGTETAYDPTKYYLDNFDNDLRASMKSPNNLVRGTRQSNNIKAVYVAGYGENAADVPSALRRAIIAMVGALYSNRGDCSEGDCAEKCGAMKMVEHYRLEILQ
jgi:hypothetical protein